jgi:hypothetical protein
MAAIPRFGTRVVPEMRQIIDECRAHKQLVEGPCTDQFEQEFARFLGSGHVRTCSTEYGRMALYFILKAMAFPPGSEIIVPALTFWVVPEIARVAGLKVVFADIDPATFGLSPAAVERAITPNTRAVLPTHLYGMACEMDPILELARRYQLKVIEDCAHSLGATYKGRLVGTLGDASFFSFQAFKPLNTYGGGLAWMRDADLAQRVGALAAAEDWPTEKRVEGILRTGYWQHTFIRPKVFTYSLFPIWYAASWVDAKPEERLWEGVRSLDPDSRALPWALHKRTGRHRIGRSQAPPGVHSSDAAARAHAGRRCSAMSRASRFRRSRPIERTCTTNTVPTCPPATPS